MNYIKNDIKLVLIFIIIGFLIGPKIFADQKNNDAIESKSIVQDKNSVNKKDSINAFDNIKIFAESAYVYDIANQKVIYAKDAETKRPLASITKIMTAIVALETKNILSQIEIKSDDLAIEGDNGLKEHEKWSLNSLLALTLVTSSNDGASAIAASVGSLIKPDSKSHSEYINSFVSKMNEKSKELEFNSFYFTTPTGLDVGDTPGGVGSAHDVAKLFEYTLRRHSNLLQYTAIPEITVTSQEKIPHRVINTNEIASVTPGIIGGKTGYTDLAGGNLAMIVDIGIQRPVIVVVLGSTREKRFTDVQELLDRAKIALN